MQCIGRIEVRPGQKDLKTTIYITDESVKPIKTTNMPFYMLSEKGYNILDTFEHRGNYYLILEKVVSGSDE